MREYELNFIIQPEISEEGSKAILDRLDAILTESEAVRLLCDDLGKRKLAYEVRKFQKGHYYILSFLDPGQVVPALERALRLEESVLRFLSVKVADRVTDIEGRVAEAKEKEVELQRRAAERAAREAEEVKARAESEAAAERAAAEAAMAADAQESEAAEEPVEAAAEPSDDEAAEGPVVEEAESGEEEGEK
ncbi:MAG: 30S ribosomal protein S6 [Myxococcota bacterium]|nr:30S ribosomal protein S6 [Myxococcota bacterium]